MSLSSVPAERTGSWSFDISSRQQSRALYNSVYLASEDTLPGWNGDISTCSADTTSADFKNSVLARINYYRAMAGIPSDITLNGTYSAKSQQAALIMSRNNGLAHTVPPEWECYTADGAEAASSSNLSLGSYGWQAIDGQMRDNGSNNEAVGHRRWILYPQTREMGTGDVPYSESGSPAQPFSAANSLWVFDDNNWGSRPDTRDPFVAWPPPGYTPYQVVPPRWSFAVAGADFSNASVSMTVGGVPVDITVLPLAPNRGENTIVWVPDSIDATLWNASWPRPDNDTTYTITISNYEVSSTNQTTSYDVTVFDPAIPGVDEEFPVISGPVYPVAGTPATYSFTPVSFAESYEQRNTQIINQDFFEGAETGSGNLVDGTSSSYELITSGDASSGSYSLHLAHPLAVSESFEIDRTFIPAAGAMLHFDMRLGSVTTDENLLVQIKRNGAPAWDTIYTQPGCGGFCQDDFSSHSFPLSDYVDSFIRVRFVFYFESGSYYDCTSTGCGLLIDNIALENTAELASSEIAAVIGTTFEFTGDAPGSYALAVRAIPWDGYAAVDWGPLHYATVKDRTELADALAILASMADGENADQLTELIGILQVLSGD